VTEEFLDGPDVVPILDEMGRERMPECVAGDRLLDARPHRRALDGPLDDRFVEVVSKEEGCCGIGVLAARGEDPLPAPQAVCARVFSY